MTEERVTEERGNREVGFFALWLSGLLLAALRPLLGLWGIRRLCQGSSPVTHAPTLALASECVSVLGLARTPSLRQAAVPVPMTWGWRRPIVLLPLGTMVWPEGRLRAVLLHEMAHVRRRDWPGHRLADLACALYWFHPLVWPLARRLRAEGESACDDLVLTSGVAAPDYARHLLEVARALRPATVPQVVLAMARTARLERRLTMILDPSRPRRALTRRALLLVLTPGLTGLTALAMLRPAAKAQPTPAAINPAVSASLSHTPEAPGKIARYFIGSSPLHRLMKQEGSITWTRPRLALLPKASPLTAKPRVESPSKHLKTAASKLVPPASPAPRTASAAPDYVSRIDRFPRLVSTDGTLPVLSVDGLKLNSASVLAGVTNADKPGSSWWSATGAVLPTLVYDTAAYKAEQHPSGRADRRTVLFAFRFPASAQDITVQYELPQSLGSSSDGFWPTKIAENAHRTEAQLFSRTNGSRVVMAEFPAALSKADIQVGIATGPWKLAASYAPIPGGFGNIDVLGNAKFLFSPISETKDGATQSIATDATDDLRVIAVDVQGKETLPLLVGGSSAGGLDHITARFGLPLAQIKEIHVETRPFQWIEFKNVALRPVK